MIKKIILSFFLICLFVAIPLAIMGIKKVEPGAAFIGFTHSLNNDFEAWKLTIPDIPNIPVYDNAEGFEFVLNVLIKLVNMLSSFINVLASIINVLINVIQFILTVSYEIGYWVTTMLINGDNNYQWAWSGYHPPVV